MIDTVLGRKTPYPYYYQPDLLFSIERQPIREAMGIRASLPFVGHDVWNSYELSWLNQKGKPEVAIVQWVIPADSGYLIESKSLKLYLNSFNQSYFENMRHVQATLASDLSRTSGAEVLVTLKTVNDASLCLTSLEGYCLDTLNITCSHYTPCPKLLCSKEGSSSTKETLYSHLLKSNCPVTGQPDWGSVVIHYEGRPIHHESLLCYLISFRQHQAFHEACVEQIFIDIMQQCQPDALCVEARYTRRGGLDINPVRSTDEKLICPYRRLGRQ